MAVEFAAERSTIDLDLAPLALSGDDPLVLDWRPTLASLLAAKDLGASAADLAAAFHHALANAMIAVARRIDMERVVLSGGCFQNARLTELAVTGLAVAGFEVYRQRRVPPNDGGLAAGQALFAARWMAEELR
jgi:hydrogenase maturation protein HypF